MYNLSQHRNKPTQINNKPTNRFVLVEMNECEVCIHIFQDFLHAVTCPKQGRDSHVISETWQPCPVIMLKSQN